MGTFPSRAAHKKRAQEVLLVGGPYEGQTLIWPSRTQWRVFSGPSGIATYELDRSKPIPYIGVAFPSGYSADDKAQAVQAFRARTGHEAGAGTDTTLPKVP